MFDTTREDFYIYNDTNEGRERTKKRLEELIDLGLDEVGTAEFGIRGVISGIYIERVWRFSAREWQEQIDWVKSIINQS